MEVPVRIGCIGNLVSIEIRAAFLPPHRPTLAHKNAGLLDVFARTNINNKSAFLFLCFPGFREEPKNAGHRSIMAVLSTANKRQDVSVDFRGIGDRHAVWEAWIFLQGAVFQQLYCQRC